VGDSGAFCGIAFSDAPEPGGHDRADLMDRAIWPTNHPHSQPIAHRPRLRMANPDPDRSYEVLNSPIIPLTLTDAVCSTSAVALTSSADAEVSSVLAATSSADAA